MTKNILAAVVADVFFTAVTFIGNNVEVVFLTPTFVI